MATSTTIENAIERDSEKRRALIAKAKHDTWERKQKLIPFHTKDSKTVFYCRTKEAGEKRIADYEKKQKIYIGI